jgi:hypothetical protein
MYHAFRKSNASTFLALLILALECSPAHAYLGPGGAVSGIGALLALIGAVLLSIVGFVWYPIKRMLTGKQRASETDDEDDEDEKDPREKSEKP